jgi:tetratricopeptide (TPR) repeat protein
MAGYWVSARRKLETGRDALAAGRFAQAEQLFCEARAAIADGAGVACPRWGIATLDLAKCAHLQGNHALARRRGMNALRVLMAEGSSALALPAADAAAVVGDALCELDACDEAVRYLEFALTSAGTASDAVLVASHANVKLAFAYANVGRDTDAGDAITRAWSSIADKGSWLRGREARIARWMIGHLQRAGRFVEARPAWEWLAEDGMADADWLTLHRFIGEMSAAGLKEEAKALFCRVEELEDVRASGSR